MPIVRSYMCGDCAHHMTVMLSAEQWDDPAPDCPVCTQHAMRQEFVPIAINGSASARAHAIAEDIVANDYKVANMSDARKEGDVPKVRYKDESLTSLPKSTWSGVSHDTMQQALVSGRETRLNFGSGLDILQQNLKNGTEPDLIALSKRKALRVW
jgi:hypothetical protein